MSTLSTFIDDIQFYSQATNDENAISIKKYRACLSKVATKSFANEATRENRVWQILLFPYILFP